MSFAANLLNPVLRRNPAVLHPILLVVPREAAGSALAPLELPDPADVLADVGLGLSLPAVVPAVHPFVALPVGFPDR